MENIQNKGLHAFNQLANQKTTNKWQRGWVIAKDWVLEKRECRIMEIVWIDLLGIMLE